jgi:uncharacterized protein (DUF1697 family)
VTVKKQKSGPTIFVALLRGINVGGNNMIRMSSLKASFEGMSFKDVSTYINSGNIIFRAKEGDARKLERNIERNALERIPTGMQSGCAELRGNCEPGRALAQKLG